MAFDIARSLLQPDKLDNIIVIARLIRKSPLSNQMESYLMEQPELSCVVHERWRPPSWNAESLLALPSGSLGRTYVERQLEHGVTPKPLLSSEEIKSNSVYINHRLRETHDIAHILTGFGNDRIGELGLQAFSIAQYREPLAVMLVFGGLVKTLYERSELGPLLHSICLGLTLGLNAKCLLAQKFEEAWHLPLLEWRQRMGLPPDPQQTSLHSRQSLPPPPTPC